MNALPDFLTAVLRRYDFLTALAVVGLLVSIAEWSAARFTRGRLHGSALAIAAGLLLAGLGGALTGGTKGLADLPLLGGLGLLGGDMFRDVAIVSTAFGVRVAELRKGGLTGLAALVLGLSSAFTCGCMAAWACGYRDAESLATIGAGAATYIVGPVTGTAVGAQPAVIAISFAAGLVKAILVMLITPAAARPIGLNNPRAAMIYGGLMGTNSGVMAGLAATDPKLVPYAAMTAAFYTGLGCLAGPLLLYPLLCWLL
ncbi:MAG: malonate transporter, MadM subunit [Planctomycetota bacterium]|jgi:malonate transporter MadM subunit